MPSTTAPTIAIPGGRQSRDCIWWSSRVVAVCRKGWSAPTKVKEVPSRWFAFPHTPLFGKSLVPRTCQRLAQTAWEASEGSGPAGKTVIIPLMCKSYCVNNSLLLKKTTVSRQKAKKGQEGTSAAQDRTLPLPQMGNDQHKTAVSWLNDHECKTEGWPARLLKKSLHSTVDLNTWKTL